MVTEAIVRDVDLGPGIGVLALITLDNGHDHTKPSTFGPQGLLSLSAALDAVEARAATGEIVAAGVTGKPFILAAGADLDGAAAAISGAGVDPADARERAIGIASLGHAVFRRLGELPVPSFAFINGVALGGGLEVALHCTYRTISSGAPMVAFPECFLGLVPGWGGTYLLPRLIGPSAALKLIIENPLSQNKMLRGPEAFSLGIADAMFEPADFLEESLRWASGVLSGAVSVSRQPARRTGSGSRRRQGPPRSGPRRSRRPGSSPTGSCTVPRPRRTGPWTWLRRRAPLPATRGSPPRTRPWPTCCCRMSCAPGSTRSTSCRSGPASPPAPRTERSPGRSPRSASSARASWPPRSPCSSSAGCWSPSS